MSPIIRRGSQMADPEAVTIRRAVAGDEAEVLRCIRALADYEGAPEAVDATEESLRATLFRPEPVVHALLAEQAGRVVGLALWFLNYSTWTGRSGIYLEDLFVEPGARGAGVGRRLMARLAAEAVAGGHARLDWSVLDWNEKAMGFYRAIGGRHAAGWQPWRLEGAALAALAAEG